MRDHFNAPILQFENLSSSTISKLLKGDEPKVLVGGCFDILHLGHVVFLEKSRKLGSYLVVAVESDRFISEIKSREPFHNQSQRSQVLAALRSVDLIIEMPYLQEAKRTSGYRKLVENVSPRYIAVTDHDAMLEIKKEHAKSINAEVKIVTKLLDSLSSSVIAKYGTLLND